MEYRKYIGGPLTFASKNLEKMGTLFMHYYIVLNYNIINAIYDDVLNSFRNKFIKWQANPWNGIVTNCYIITHFYGTDEDVFICPCTVSGYTSWKQYKLKLSWARYLAKISAKNGVDFYFSLRFAAEAKVPF